MKSPHERYRNPMTQASEALVRRLLGDLIDSHTGAPLNEAVRAAAAAPARIVGSAAQLVADGLAVTDATPLHVDAAGAPDIDWVARMGAALPEGQAPPKPQYLRAPDAQPQNAAQLPRR